MAVTLALHYTRPLLCQLSSRPLPQLRLYIKLTLNHAPCKSTLTKLSSRPLLEVLRLPRAKVFFPTGCSFAHPPPCLAAPLEAGAADSSSLSATAQQLRACSRSDMGESFPGFTLPLGSGLTDVCLLFHSYCPSSAVPPSHHGALPCDKRPAPPFTPWPHNSSFGGFDFSEP